MNLCSFRGLPAQKSLQTRLWDQWWTYYSSGIKVLWFSKVTFFSMSNELGCCQWQHCWGKATSHQSCTLHKAARMPQYDQEPSSYGSVNLQTETTDLGKRCFLAGRTDRTLFVSNGLCFILKCCLDIYECQIKTVTVILNIAEAWDEWN